VSRKGLGDLALHYSPDASVTAVLWCARCADYTFGERKFGGNAQAITKQRWLHHTSLLWGFESGNMALLKHPSRVPEYRAVRH
jgi:lipoate-protein ligase A